ncbi:MAG TPA: metallophosphoesterase [Desulfatiglandales bacterium]|nr:metallophosphoesterase [Desulfatiglandales bacterium]
MNRLPSFILFFTIFLSLYGLLHFYFYWKVVRAFEMVTAFHLLFIIILIFLLLSPVITNISSNTERFLMTTILAYISYIWMAVLLLFFSINIMIDLYGLILNVSARWFVAPAILRFIPEARTIFIAVILTIAGINIYGFYEAGNIVIERITLRTSKLPPEMDSFRAVQISDIHFSPTNGLRLAKKIHGIIKGLKPDLLVSSGDLFDGGLKEKEAIIELFRDLEPPYGKYACAGNHEFIHGIEQTSEFIERAGFRFLRNECIKAGDFLSIAAIDDPTVTRFGNDPPVSEDRVLAALSDDRLNIFLKHQPGIQAGSIGKFDIQLSGHTHKGQIFPFTLIVRIFYPYMDGLFDLGKGSHLYVSRGTGTWGPPIRFLTFPEITVIEFVRN